MWQLCIHKQGTRRPERAGDSPGGTGLGPGRTARSSVPLCSRHVVARDWGHPTTSQSKKQARMETADRRCANPSRTPPRARLRNVLPSPSRSVCSLAGGHFPLLPGSCRRVQRSQQWPVGLESAGSQAREPPAPPELDPLAKGCASQTVLGPGCTSPATGAGCIGRRVGRQPGGDASEGRGVRADARAEGGTPGLPGGGRCGSRLACAEVSLRLGLSGEERLWAQGDVWARGKGSRVPVLTWGGDFSLEGMSPLCGGASGGQRAVASAPGQISGWHPAPVPPTPSHRTCSSPAERLVPARSGPF